MGMFDTIYFDQKYSCPLCGKEIGDIQIKEFENLLNYYHVKDYIRSGKGFRMGPSSPMMKLTGSRARLRIQFSE